MLDRLEGGLRANHQLGAAFRTLERDAGPVVCRHLIGSGARMIDNPVMAMDLMGRLETALPVPARLTPEVQASLSSQSNDGKPVTATCNIVGLHYMADEGGILCRLDLELNGKNEAFVSITHLRFDARLPLARAITIYQKHRVKRLRRQPF
jgi:hypothetical protein